MMGYGLFVLALAGILLVPSEANPESTGSVYSTFAGTIPGPSSWFDATLWTGFSEIPNNDDTVILNTADSYLSVDIGQAEVMSLIVGQNTTACDRVQLDVLTGRDLIVGTIFTIGDSAGSDGTVYSTGDIVVGGEMVVGNGGSGIFIMMGGTLNVTGTLSIGKSSSGMGTVHIGGASKVFAKELVMNTASRLEMTFGDTITLWGDHVDKLHAFIASGQILSTGNIGPLYAVFDCTRNTTVLKGVPSSAAVSSSRRYM